MSEALPAATLTDWISYADAVVAVTVADEVPLPANPDEEASGEGLIARTVTVRIDETLWAHASGDAPVDQFEFTAIGWILHDGIRSPAAPEGAARLEVGERYLMPITFWPAQGEWAPIAPSSVTPLSDTVGEPGDPTDAQAALSGQDLSSVATELSTVRPDPAAERHRDLPSIERYAAANESS